MKLLKNGLAHALAQKMLTEYLEENAVKVQYYEIEALVERMLYSAYAEGVAAARDQVANLSMELMTKSPELLSIGDIEDKQQKGKLWRC